MPTGVLSLINVFGNLNFEGPEDLSLSENPVRLPFWVYVGIEDANPKDEYELTIEGYAPSGEQVLNTQIVLKNPESVPHVNGAKKIEAIITQEGDYSIDVKLQGNIARSRMLSVTRR